MLNRISKMKSKFRTAVCAIILLCVSTPCFADDQSFNTIADVVLVRPGCMIATAIGSAFFVVSLPFAAASKSVKKTANTLVVKPAKAAFTRPVGDMDSLIDY